MGVTVRHAESASDIDSVCALCWDYRALLVERCREVIPEIIEHYYPEDRFADLLDRLEDMHLAPKGAIYVAEIDENIIGCGMTHEISEGITEIKRVFVDPIARGQGAARKIFEVAIEESRRLGQSEMVLDTMKFLTEAIALYGRLGFSTTPPFYEPEPVFEPYLHFFGKTLDQ